MHDYTDVDAFPVIVQIIDDSDSPAAANFNTAPEGVLNRTFWLRKRLPSSQTLTLPGGGGLSGTFVVPQGVTSLMGIGCGGGGGGGGGWTDGSGVIDRWFPGGGGGGAAQVSTQCVAVTPGETLTYSVGVGGDAGVAVDFGDDGNGGDGFDTTISRSGTPIMTFKGGEGGYGANVVATTGVYAFALGGGPVPRGLPSWAKPELTADRHLYRFDTPGAGGAGTSSNNLALGRAGNGSGEGFAGGTPGIKGTDSGGYRGGGPGGGGGASAYGAGGHGGNGGAGHSGAVGSDGTGGSGAAGIGAGGGGGGAAGSGNTAGGLGGTGGGGARGQIQLFWVEEGTR